MSDSPLTGCRNRRGGIIFTMTSVLCNVCTQRITVEADRVYCFGGCEEIYHSKCCDISAAAGAAMKANVALKYFCFECRKNRSSLNDILLKCNKLCQKVDKLETSVLLNESKRSSDLKEQFDALENRLLAVVQNAISGYKCAGIESRRSYAEVTSNESRQGTSLNLSLTNPNSMHL